MPCPPAFALRDQEDDRDSPSGPFVLEKGLFDLARVFAQASPVQADEATSLFEQIRQYLEDCKASIDGLKADKASLEAESQAAATKAAAADADAQAKERALVGREQELDESRDCCARLEGLVSRLNGLVQGLAGDVAKEVGEFDLPTLRIASAAAPAASPTGAGADTVALA
ncbi:hypothetical protein NBRC10512v2_006217 [Rhodotorula toruloides]|uniref:Uncharacterized protein n=1 Tax=Rhodotorula toruloides (strain NP11) TaxID=1130832 RepID=M7WKJ6_RHOT1|nr:uncharacterized protein RHTO_05823 [Rhodotorula toruloides NP11]EMS18571.1 hypothetical protein RHTO_05823 [Rhodotorula toruloides NP11]